MDQNKMASQVAALETANTFIWATPTFDQVKMDAEIGSYNEDTDPAREDSVAVVFEATAAA